MATLLGTANIQGAFTTTSEALVVTDDLNRVTTTAYRKPVAVHSGTDTSDFRPLFANDVNLYLQGGYVDDDYLENNKFVEFIQTASSPNSPGTQTVFCNFNFLEVDPTATIANVEVRITLQSTQGGYTSFPPYGTQDELHYGKVKMLWADRGSGVSEEMVTSKVTTNELTTLAFTLTPVGLDPAGFWTGIGMGDNAHMVKLTLEGVVNPPLPTFPQQSLNMKIYAIEARANYTGRTRFTTGFKSPATISGGTGSTALSSTGYGFAIPSGHVVDGVAVRFGADHPGSGNPGHGQGFNPDVPNVMHFVSGGSQVSTSPIDLDSDTLLAVSPEFYDYGTRERHETLYQAIDYHNTDTAITTAEVNASDFGITTQFFPVSGSVGFDLEPSTLDINIAHVGPIISGDIDLNTVSTVTATPTIVHAFTSDEIDDFTGTLTLTALGGFLITSIVASEPTVSTVSIGTAGRIRTDHTVSMPTQFGVTVSAINDLSGSALSFPTATVTVSSVVERTTPAQSTSVFTTQLGTAGMTRTNHTVTAPAVATFAAVSQVALIKATDTNRIFVADSETRTHLIDTEIRTHTMEQQTRTHQIDTDVRTIVVDQQTRTVDTEGL